MLLLLLVVFQIIVVRLLMKLIPKSASQQLKLIAIVNLMSRGANGIQKQLAEDMNPT
jgi:hypothetical protein